MKKHLTQTPAFDTVYVRPKNANTTVRTPSAFYFYARFLNVGSGLSVRTTARLYSCFWTPDALRVKASNQKENTMSNEIITFNFKNNAVRTQSINGAAWFCFADCREALGIKGSLKKGTLAEKGVTKTYTLTNGGKQSVTFINEPNLYRLIFRSNKPQAQAFADWVYEEVLPSIRRTGAYVADKPVTVAEHQRALPDEAIKKFLTDCRLFRYVGTTELTSGQTAPIDIADFFMPRFWGTRSPNILNKARGLVTSVESPAYSFSGGLTERLEKMKELISYTFKSTPVRTTVRDGNPWFVAADVAKALEYRDAGNAVRYLDDDEKGTLNQSTLGGNQDLIIINESGLYSLILRSRKPEAKAFKKFVTSEVLPSIRKTGAYAVNGEVSVREHEIVLSEKAKQEIGGIVKKCAAKAIKDELADIIGYLTDGRMDCYALADLIKTASSPLKASGALKENALKGLIRDVLREELAGFLLKNGVKATEPFNGNVTADGLPAANWALSIVHGASALQHIIGQLTDKQKEAVKLLA